MVSLDTKLKSGDIIEIIIDKHRKNPNPDWLKFIKTNLARNKIRTATNRERLARWLADIGE
jgi:GTP pyrophosphokinase